MVSVLASGEMPGKHDPSTYQNVVDLFWIFLLFDLWLFFTSFFPKSSITCRKNLPDENKSEETDCGTLENQKTSDLRRTGVHFVVFIEKGGE